MHDVFDKEHRHVLRDIEELIDEADQSDVRTGNSNGSKFGSINFIKSTYTDKRNRKKLEYLHTEDGFTLLVMSYNDLKR